MFPFTFMFPLLLPLTPAFPWFSSFPVLIPHPFPIHFSPPWGSWRGLFSPFSLIYVNNREIFHDFWKIFLQRFVCLYKTPYLCIRFWEIFLLSDMESVLWETERQKSSTGVAWVDLGDNTSEATVAGRKACWYFFRGGFDFNLILGWHSEKQTDSGIPSDTYIIKTFLQWRVWSWLRMNASYRLNTCKSRGSITVACYCRWRPAHGWVTRIQPAHDLGITLRKQA